MAFRSIPRRRDAPSAEYVSLHSRASSPSRSDWNRSGEEPVVPEALSTPHFPSRSDWNLSGEEPAVPEAPSNVHSRNLDYQEQTWSLLRPQTIRWLGTVLVSILLVATVWIYQNKGNFTRYDKNVFNVIVTGLSVGLGINFFEAFKESAKGLRWRILADQRHSVRNVDLILGIESLWKVFLLATESFSSSPWTIVACVVWIALNIAAQISVALITLTYDMVDGKSFHDTYTGKGTVCVPDLGCYAGRSKLPCPEVATVHSRAHIYGERGNRMACGSYMTIDDVIKSPHDRFYYCSNNSATNPEFAYRFKEYSPRDLEETYPLFTNRTITASAGDCLVYRVENETDVGDVDGQGSGKIFTYEEGNSTKEISIPTSSLGWSATTYMYKGFVDPQHLDDHSCGPRCMWLWAYKNPGPKDDSRALYNCPVTVSEVNNTWNHSQVIPDEVARVAAVSIALQGRWTSPENHKNFNQYQFYTWGTPWEIHNHDARHVGANMARFAIGSIAEMAAVNRRNPVQGLVPHLGSHLEIRWGYVAALFAGIIGTHLVLYLSAILAIRKVAIKDDSFLAIARLLLPLLNVLDKQGTLLDGKELAEALQLRHGSNGVVVGPRKTQDDQRGYYLDIGEDVPARREWPKHRHPAGKYA